MVNTCKAILQPKATFCSSIVREPGKEHKRDEGVSGQEQEGVAGIVIVIVRRSIIAVSTHGGADENLKVDFSQHGPFRLLARAPPSLVATAPPSFSGAGRASSTVSSDPQVIS